MAHAVRVVSTREGQSQVDSKAIMGEAVELQSHVNCVHCDVMLPEFSRFCLFCGAAQFEPQSKAQVAPAQPEAALPLAEASPLQAEPVKPIEQAPEVLYVEPPQVAPVKESSPWEKIRSMQKMADAKLSRMESDRHWAKNIIKK